MKRCFSNAVTTRRAPGLIAILSLASAVPAAAAEHPTLAFVQVPPSVQQPATPDIGKTILAGRYARGMRVVVAERDDVSRTLRSITDGFVCATDPVFSYEGTRLAFAGLREHDEHLQIWEWTGDDHDLRRAVRCDADCISPVYLPDGRIVFASLLSHEYEEHGGQYSFSLYAARSGGETPTRLTLNPSSDFDPVVLRDGRVLYSSWQHVGNHDWPRGTVSLLLINSDGTGVFPLTGNHRGPWLKRGSTALTGDTIALIQSDRFSEFGAGAVVTTSLNDAFAAYAALVPADRYRVSDIAKQPGGGFVFSGRPVEDDQATFGLYVQKHGEVKIVYDDPAYHELAPAIGAAAARPELRVSTVVPDAAFGYLVVLNCYETDRTDQHPLRKGSVKAVRVLEGRPLRHEEGSGPEFFSGPGGADEPLIRPNAATGYIPTGILAVVPPAADGSVYLKVPADRPLRLQLVDQDGFAIVNERAWFWVRPNERRVCIGCHEHRELAPRNAAPLAVRRAPTDLTDPAAWRAVSFRRDVQPILRTNCALADCHVPPTPTAGMNLTAHQLNGAKDAALADRFGPAYANLLMRREDKPFSVGGRRVHPGDARSSPMLWMLYGRALAPQYKPAPFERPMISAHPGPMLPEAQLKLIREWIDLGAQYDDASPPGPWPYRVSAHVQKVVMEGKPSAK